MDVQTHRPQRECEDQGTAFRVRYLLRRDRIQVTRLAQTQLCPQSYFTGPLIVFFICGIINNNIGQCGKKDLGTGTRGQEFEPALPPPCGFGKEQ